MAHDLKDTTELQARIDAVATLPGRSPAEVVADALVHGHGLEWQERFIARVKAGIADADAGRYATVADRERVRRRYRAA